MPSLDEIGKRKVRAALCAEISQRKTDRFGRGGVIRREIGCYFHSSVLHVADGNQGGRRLLVNEALEIIQLRAQAESRTFIDEDCQRQPGLISFGWDPSGDRETIMTLIDHYVLLSNSWNLVSMLWFHADNHLNGFCGAWFRHSFLRVCRQCEKE